MFKGFTTEVANEVGKSGAILLNQLYQWFKNKNRDKIFRTNSELSQDLCGLLSVATIQRAKIALIEKGYVEVSFDKGYKRTTHYKLTDKAIAALTKVNESVEKVVEKTKDVVKKAASGVKSFVKPKAAPNGNQPSAGSESMKASFKEGMTNEKAIPCPRDLFSKLLKCNAKKDPVDVENKPKTETYEDDSHLFPQREIPVVDRVQEISDEEYFSGLSSTVGLAYNQMPNIDILNKNMQEKVSMQNFSEDW